MAGIFTDIRAHGESWVDARRDPGMFTILGHEGEQLVGYSIWRLVDDVLYVWPQRHWGACRHAPRRAFALAMAEGRRRGARLLLDITWLRPEVVQRLSGMPVQLVREVWVHGG